MKISVLAVIAAIIITLAATQTAKAEQIDVNFATGNTPSLGNYHIQYLHSNINRDKSLTEGYNLLAKLRYAEAEKALFRCIAEREPVFVQKNGRLSAHPSLPLNDRNIASEAYTYMAYCCFNEAKLDKAEEYCNKAIILNPSNQYAYFYLANVYLQNGDKKALRENLSKSLEIDPTFTSAMRILAESYKDEGDAKNSTKLYGRIVDLLPESGYYRYQYYKTLLESKDFEKAEMQLKEMISRQPNFMENYLRLGDVYRQEGKTDKALDEYANLLTKLAKDDKLVARAHIGRASTYLDSGDLREAKRELDTAKKTSASPKEIADLQGKIDKKAKEQNTKNLYIAGMIALAIAIVGIIFFNIHRSNTRKNKEQTLSQFNEALDKIPNVQHLASFLPEFFAKNLNTITGFLMVYSRHSNTLFTVNSHLVHNMIPIRIITTSEVTNWTLQESRPIMSVKDLLHSQLFNKAFPSLAERLSSLHVGHVVVLKDKSTFTGFITLGEMNQGNAVQKRILLDIMEPVIAASAQTVQTQFLIENSIRDELTGLYNKKHLYQSLEEELSRAKRYRQPCSFCSIDIDDFKYINDNYGHEQGDIVLKEIGRIITANIRDGIDIGIRAGGEEFAIILPATTLELADKVADRIRQTVMQTAFEGFETHRTVTISIGISTYPEPAIDDNDLIETAEKALLKAKQSGKNQVCLYDGSDDEINSPAAEQEKKKEFKLKSGQISLDNQFDRLNFYDPQTKLPSYSYFSMKVKDEIKRCDRYRLTCSMVIFSIHPDVSDDMRDRIMENFGEVLRTKYREGIDIPTRLNESSVLLIAPETPKDKAVVLAQRMQYATAALGMLTPSGHPVRTVCAVGSYPECADTGDELLNRLISALDIAKVMDTGICVCGSSNK